MKKYTPEQLRFLALRTIGNFLVLSSLFGMFMTFGPAVKNELVYRYNRWKGVQYVVSATSPEFSITPTPIAQPEGPRSFFKDVLGKEGSVEVLTPIDSSFGIIIPKIAANAKVIPDVDASNYDLYMSALSRGVAHAQRTLFPGEGGNIYLFAHSTDNFWNGGRYNAIFYLLKELQQGDEVDMFYKGIRYIYTVTDTKIIEPTDVNFLTESTPTEQLTLQTCWPPGTTLKRLIVIAKPVREI